jgi:hypothetical protein
MAAKGGKGKPSDGGEDPPPVLYQIQYFDMPNLEYGEITDANNSGQVVGWYAFDLDGDGAGETWRAFLYDPALDADQAIDLNLIVAGIPDGWAIRKANAINKWGDIAAYLEPIASGGSLTELEAGMIDMNAVDPLTGENIPQLHIIPDSSLTSYSVVKDMNDLGDIVVNFKREDGSRGNYLYNFGLYAAYLEILTPFNLLVNTMSDGPFINNERQIVGVILDGTSNYPYKYSFNNGGYETFPTITPTSIGGLNDLGDFSGTTSLKVRKSRTRNVAYVMGTVLEVFDSMKWAGSINKTSDFVNSGQLYHQTHGLLIPSNLIDPDDADASIWNASNSNAISTLSDRDPLTGFPKLYGRSYVYDGNYSAHFILTPVPVL